MNIRKLLLLLLMLLAATLLPAARAAAHVSESNNGVSAVLHIVPDDNPVAGQPTNMEFSFGFTGGTFIVAQCGCKLVVNDDGQDIGTVILKPGSSNPQAASASVTFPKGGVYNLILSGYTTAGHETTFRLNYLIRVADAGGSGANTTGGIEVIMLSLTVLAILGGTAYYGIKDNPRYARQQPPKK